MDSPFNKGFGPGHQSSALSQAPPAGSAYQVNVNRTKTRKWVEARVQSYDGDDWGADEYDDEPEPEPEPPAQQPSTQRPGAGTGVASLPSSLQAQQPPRPAPPHHASPAISDPSITESPVDRDKTVSSQSTGAGPSNHSSSRLAEPDEPSVGGAAPLLRPSDEYRRMDEENQRHRQPETEKEALLAEVPSKSNRLDSPGGRGDPPHAGGGAESAGQGDGGRRDSVSPQLPDVARMSAFGVDLFASTGSGFAIGPMIPEHEGDGLPSSSPPPRTEKYNDASALVSDPCRSPPATRKTPPGLQSVSHYLEEVNGGEAPAKDEGLSKNTTKEPGEVALSSSDDKDRDPDHGSSSAAADTVLAHPQARQPILHLGSGWPTIPPLRTPSPRASVGNVAEEASPSGGSLNIDDNKPTAASDAYKQREPGHDFETISIQRQPTTSTIASSPVKDNDVLSDEILRSLSPGASSPADPSSPGDGRKSFLSPSPNAVRESSYTLRDYDSYWADTSDKAQAAPPITTTLESKEVADSPPEASGLDENACVDELDSRKRFSWEADEDAESPKPADTAPGTVAKSDGGQEPPEVPQPPSPLSASSDRPASGGRDSTRLSRSDEGAQAPDSSRVFSPTPPPESQRSPAGQPPSEAVEPQSPHHPTQAPGMMFREILALPAPAERITRYNETRNYFASADTGLNTWLEDLQAQNPEYANGSEFLAAATPHPLVQAESHPSSASAQPPAQQPYYQQYLNATVPSTSSAGRSRLGGSQMPSQPTGSAFGNPSHQIGFKSKEFMHSAGKMGKGLLSKGKNKLRGSGDKGESANSLVHTNPKNDRRASWAFSLGARSRPGEAAPRAASAALSNTGGRPSSSVDTRRHEQAPQLSPLVQSRSHDLESLGKLQPVRYLNHPGSADRVTAGLSRLEIPAYLGNGVTQPQDASQLPEQRDVAQDQALDDWVVVPRQDNDEQQVASLPAAARAQPTASSQGDDGGVALQPYIQAQNDVPKRTSSFVGLPPIRRSSTFGITTRAKRASRRFSLDDDDVRDNGNDRGFSVTGDGSRRSVGPEEPLPLIPWSVLQFGSSTEPALGDNGISGAPVPKQEQPRGPEHLERPVQSKLQAIQLPALESSDAALPVHTRLSPMLASPIPGLATGPWKLEESHLSEPLHSVTRHRPGTASSQQPMFYGYDKETGSPDHLRQRSFDVPPSSAQRWPDLFSHPITHDTQRPRSHSRTRVESDSHPYTAPPLRGETSRNGKPNLDAVRTSQGDCVPNQQGLGIFRHPGILSTGTSSRNWPAWSPEAQPAASESGIAAENIQEAKGKQPSFLPGFTGRASADHDSIQKHSVGGHDQSNPEVWAPGMPWQSQPDPNSSLVGSGGEITPKGARRPSASSFLNDSNLADADNFEVTKKKKRLSSMVNLTSFKDMIYGSAIDRSGNSQAPQTPRRKQLGELL
ncbi:hypothetical protein HRG_009936 [Hirsutella rhossiliensis]|uniref:Uncharacterized protein n=1 Tax=Hirsutella rhossiliensis TaxID=111463 RepID=A0A9P8SDR8_9HYPO|nr:uncharacterized protein HRG_09936 [Hirsutella rhossiliensis]KAH0958891.1 hypothetical protein HRG_09936 [Hirsutella rhossiliensis]